MISSTFKSVLLISSVLLLSSLLFHESDASSYLPVSKGLSWNFYKSSCPSVESVIRKQLKKVFEDDIEQAAGLLRLHFHDCFVQVSKGTLNMFCTIYDFSTFFLLFS